MRAPSNRRVFVVGYDIATALGKDLATTWQRAVQGKAGFGKVVCVIRRDIEQAFRERFAHVFDHRVPTVAFTLIA